MARWRVWFWSIFAVVVMAMIALVCAVWSNLSSEWDIEADAAQFALNKSPLTHIDHHDVFTGADVQEVFEGTDSFGRAWYAFVYGSPFVVHAVPADSVMSKDQITQRAISAHIHPTQIHLGYLDANQQTRLHTNAEVVYEVSGTDETGALVFRYFDARSGKPLSA
ncbi:hypothetical protein [Alicyclobacillus pomorum]|jgi:uncharacterized protein YpmB|uniref:hypothetical protein n=1 Tax=Alicyclobacillus pomorum TaxID=204470 RepID=UPI0012EC0C96|nr:hypothetical protein [Alicyclobacillus pomorum]